MKMTTKLPAMFIAAGLSAVAFAQQPAPRQPSAEGHEQHREAGIPTFDVADKDKDGQVSRSEASAVPGLDFATADENANSSLDKKEYTAAMSKKSPMPAEPREPREPRD
jgi:hypothetical protein